MLRIAPFLIALMGAQVLAGECRALIISGDPGTEPNAAKRFEDWTTRWATMLKDAYGFKPENIRTLQRPATHANALAAFSALARESKEDDQAVLILIGHGYDSQGISKFCLVGKDLSDVDAARALVAVRSKQFIAIVTTPASLTWAKALGGPGRIVITATAKPGMRSQTYFCEFLLRALKPGNVTLLDAFNRASLNTVRWYQNQFVKGDVTTVNGTEFQEIWKAMHPGRTMEPGKPEPQEPVNDPENKEAWLTRRLITEVAGLDDNGDGVPSSVLDDEAKLAPLPGKSGDGERSRKIILGKP